MRLEVLGPAFSVCKVCKITGEMLSADFCFAARTDRELSLVCPERDAPPDALAREDGWRAFRVAGTLDFGLVGILARLSSALAGAGIGLFAVSTYDTDYILVKGKDLARALDALAAEGCTITDAEGER